MLHRFPVYLHVVLARRGAIDLAETHLTTVPDSDT